MPWIIPAAILTASNTLVVTAVFFMLYRRYREYYIKIWTLTALGFGVGPVFTLLTFKVLPISLGIPGETLAFLVSSVLLLKGIYVFLNKKYPQWLNYGCILAGSGIGAGYLIKLPFILSALPAFILITGLFIQAGLMLFRHSRLTGIGGIVGGWSMVIAGLNMLNYPFVRQDRLFGSWGYLLAAMCITGMTIGILLLYYQKVRQNLSRSEERYRFMAENARDIIYRLQIAPGLKFEFISGAVTGITGYSPEEYYNDPGIIFKIVHQDYLKIVEQMVTGEFDFHKPVTLPWTHKDGRSVWVEQHIHPVTGETGQIIALEGIGRNVTERVALEEQLKLLSMKDPVTGIYNRAFFEQACRYFDTDGNNPLGIIICDIDGLKLINDTLGHDSGDWLLSAATWAIQDSFRQNDIIARIGGDEFAVLLPKTPPSLVEKSVKRIEAAVQRYNDSGVGVHLSMSVGFAFRNDSSVSIADLFKNADNNMYREKLYRSHSIRSTIVNTLMKALEARDFITEGHTERLQKLVIGLAVAVGFPEVRLTDLRLLAQFHDIGKVGIPDRILFKPGKLDPEEMLEMQRHSEIGYRIAQSSPDLGPITNWILRHHEWWDGTGYPLQLKGEEIPLECRILAIVDAYDSMTNDRPYRKAMEPEMAIKELINGAGVQFDPYLVDEFVKLYREWPKEDGFIKKEENEDALI